MSKTTKTTSVTAMVCATLLLLIACSSGSDGTVIDSPSDGGTTTGGGTTGGSTTGGTTTGGTTTGGPVATTTFAKTLGSSNDNNGVSAIGRDSLGNLYVGGKFSNSSTDANAALDFDNNTINGKTTTPSTEAFVAKLNAAGTVVWFRSLGGTGTDGTNGLAVDGSGNVYATGVFVNSSADIRTATDFAGQPLLGVTTANTTAIFLAKLDTDGTQQWIVTLGGNNGTISGNAVAVNDDGSIIYAGGNFANSSTNTYAAVDFAGNSLLGKSTATPPDGYVARLNSSGVQQWIRTLGGTSTDYVNALDIDSADNVYVGGMYRNGTGNESAVLDFNNTTLLGKTSTAGFDGWVAKLDSSGTQQWIRTFGGTSTSDTVTDVAVDKEGDDSVYVGALYGNNTSDASAALDFTGAQLLGLTTSNTADQFVAKFDSSGTQSWLRRAGGGGVESTLGVSVSSTGGVLVHGTFSGSIANANGMVDFAGTLLPGAHANLTFDSYVAELDATGVQQWVKVMGGSGTDAAEDVISEENGNVVIVGSLQNGTTNAGSCKDVNGNTILGKATGGLSRITGYVIRFEP